MTRGAHHVRAPLLRAEWRADAAPGEAEDWDLFLVFHVPVGCAWRVRSRWPLAVAVHHVKQRLSARRGPARDEVSVNLGRPGPLIRWMVRVEYVPAPVRTRQPPPGHSGGTAGSRRPR